MQGVTCNKCRVGKPAEGDSWCIGCSGLELSVQLFRKRWTSPGIRAVAEEAGVSCARFIKALHNLDSNLAQQARAQGQFLAAKSKVEPPRSRSPRDERPPLLRAAPGREPAARSRDFSEGKRLSDRRDEVEEEEPDRSYSYSEESEEEERSTDEIKREEEEEKKPAPHHSRSEGRRREEREDKPEQPRSSRGSEPPPEPAEPPKKKKNRGRKKNRNHHRGGSKHQRHYREQHNPLKSSHRRLDSSHLELSRDFDSGIRRRY